MGETCYCSERVRNPELYASIPEGYCGLCEVCSEPGHQRAHPHLPTSGAWCDRHWDELIRSPQFAPTQMLVVLLLLAVFAALVGPALWRAFVN